MIPWYYLGVQIVAVVHKPFKLEQQLPPWPSWPSWSAADQLVESY
jgi:hypothetical protein